MSESKDSLYIVKSKSLFFLVKVGNVDRDDGTVHVVQVQPLPKDNDDEIADIMDVDCLTIKIHLSIVGNTGVLMELAHQDECTVVRSMSRGEGTSEMVLATLSLCKRLFGIGEFALRDASFFLCEEAGDMIRLRDHSLLVHGNTWYERKFNAVPSSTVDESELDYVKELLGDKVREEYAVHLAATVNVTVEPPLREAFNDKIKNAVRFQTWNQLFSTLNSMEHGCVFFQPSIMSEITRMLDIPQIVEWYIPMSETIVRENLLDYKKLI